MITQMHTYIADSADVFEFGRIDRHLMAQTVSDSPRSSVVVPSKAPSSKPVPETVAKEIQKDGKVDERDTSVLKSDPKVGAALLRGSDSLSASIDAAHPAATSGAPSWSSEHEKTVAKLTEDKAHGKDLDSLKSTRDSLQKSGISADALKDLDAKIRDREADEKRVESVIKDELSKRAEIEYRKSTATDADETKSKLDDALTTAGDAFKALQDVDGHVQNSSLGVMTIESAKKVDLDHVLEFYAANPAEIDKLDELQVRDAGFTLGKMSSERQQAISAGKGVTARLSVLVSEGKYDDAHDLQSRSGKSQLLQQALRDYVSAKRANDAAQSAASDYDAQLARLDSQIETDSAALSTSTLERMNRELSTPNERLFAQQGGHSSSQESDTSTKHDPNFPVHDDSYDSTGAGDTSASDNQDGNTKQSGKKGSSDSTDTTPKPERVKINYHSGEQRNILLQRAVAAGLLPEGGNVHFDKRGNAQYTVQPGDYYWKIAAQTDGAKGDLPNIDHFHSVLQANDVDLVNKPQSANLIAGQKISLAGRSIDDLIKLLQLPRYETTEDIAFGQYRAGERQ